MKRRGAFSGFTLIEILIVIAILGLLAAIIYPVFGRVREAGRRTVCVSSLRQLGTAMMMYTQDWDKYPHAVDPADKYAPQIWQDQAIAAGFDMQQIPMLSTVLNPYTKNPQLWRCPSDTGFDRPDSLPWQLESQPTQPSCFEKYGTSYFYRTELMFRGLMPESLREPVKVNVLFDAHGDWHGPGIINRSDKRYNVLFGDWHVKSLNRDQMQAAWDEPAL